MHIKRSIWFIAATLLLALDVGWVVSAWCDETPATMRKVSVRVVEPEPAPGSFEEQPKVTWRAGNRYARVAEVPDPKGRIHGLIIINEPDVWSINLYNQSVKHLVDPGPSFNVHLPVFRPGDSIAGLKELELGRELSFFRKNHAARSQGGVIRSAATERYKMSAGAATVILWINVESKAPVRISLIHGGQIITLEYLAYEDLPFDASLFQPPPGIRENSDRR